jgi:Tfp pilus assembly protein PilO
MPLLIAGGALVVALLIWLVVVAPQSSKLSGLRAKQTQLSGQQSELAAKLSSLRSEKQALSSHCADLQKIVTQIPSVQNPTDVDAEESSFEGQLNALAGSSGVALTQFSGFTPATGAATTPTTVPPTKGAGTASAPADVTPVPTTLTVTGNYGQVSSFINGLDSFPRLFVIQTFTLAYGSTSASAASGAAGTGSGPALWTGGSPTSSSAGPYSVTIAGSIYYTSSPNALAACTKATATLK